MKENKKSFSSYFELLEIMKDMRKRKIPLLEILKELEEYENNIDTTNVSFDKQDIVSIMKQNAIPKGKFQNPTCKLYLEELEYLFNIEDELVRKILFFYLLLQKFSTHSSWPRNERDFIFELLGQKMTTAEKTEVMQKVCKQGLELRVLGKKEPILCFNLTFAKTDGDILYVASREDSPINIYNHIFKGE